MDGPQRYVTCWLVLLLVAACGGSGESGDNGTSDAAPSGDGATSLSLPPANSAFDYQLGGAYSPPAGTEVVSRDRTDSPAAGLFNICYVNGFQTQPNERDFWMTEHPDLLLRDADGNVVIDPDWDEIILDVRSEESRAALAEIVGGWIEGCAAAGFDAIEIDNLDTYSRSSGLIEQNQAVAFMAQLSDIAHGRSLSIAQKNSAEVLGRRGEMKTDFAVVEECNRFSECDDFANVYGDQIYIIEYRRADFDTGCAEHPGVSIVLRDLEVRTPSETGYVFDSC